MKYIKCTIPLINANGEQATIFMPYPLSPDNFELVKSWFQLMELPLTFVEKEEPTNDVGNCGVLIQPI